MTLGRKFLTDSNLFSAAAEMWGQSRGLINDNGQIRTLFKDTNLEGLTDLNQARINLGLRIGVDVQAYSPALNKIAGGEGVSDLAVMLLSKTTGQEWANTLGASAVDRVALLHDVDLNTPQTQGQSLVWNSTTSKWVPSTILTSGNIDAVGGDPTARSRLAVIQGYYATPEQFGAIGNGLQENATADTAGLQSAVNTGLPVRLSPNKNYIINAEITPPVSKALVVWGFRNTGVGESRLTAAAGFTGYMLRPKVDYDIRDVKLVGNTLDGCYLLGSPDNSSGGLVRVERVYISNADIGIYFGGAWEHPWGLYYNQIAGFGFNTGGICLGGTSGTASSGESAWTMDNININGSTAGSGIPATGVSVGINNPDATHDLITWDNTVPPLYGWCVMRSADGTTGWHVPPNWTSSGLNAGTFSAQKASGETWTYQVVRMTHGVHLRRSKAVFSSVMQSEYFGIGIYVESVNAINIGQVYYENRDRAIPLSMFAGLYADKSQITLGGGWVEQCGYGIISAFNAEVTVNGPMRVSNCKWGKAGVGGATTQSLRHPAGILATGITPNTIVSLSGSVFDYIRYGVEEDTVAGSMTLYVDGATASGVEARYRGATKSRIYINASGEGEVACDRLKLVQPNKIGVPPIANLVNRTTITSGTATPFMTISGIPTNTAAAVSFLISIRGSDGSSVTRQNLVCRLDVSLLEVAGTGVTTAVIASAEAKAVQLGTMGTPAFTASVSSGVVTISCNITVTGTTSLFLYAVPVAGLQSAHSLVITQL